MSSGYKTGRFADVSDPDQVKTHADIARIVEQMRTDLLDHPDEWRTRPSNGSSTRSPRP